MQWYTGRRAFGLIRIRARQSFDEAIQLAEEDTLQRDTEYAFGPVQAPSMDHARKLFGRAYLMLRERGWQDIA